MMNPAKFRRCTSTIEAARLPRFRSDRCLNPLLWRRCTRRPPLEVSRAYFPDRETIDEGRLRTSDGGPRVGRLITLAAALARSLTHSLTRSLTRSLTHSLGLLFVSLAESMSILDRHRELFAKFATPGNALTRDGLSAIMQSVGSEVVPLNWLTDEDIDGAMNAYDLNHDGLISQEEFEQMAKDNVFLLRSLNEYRQIFDSLDTGKNNLIGPTEMYRYFEDQKCGDGYVLHRSWRMVEKGAQVI